MNENCAGILSGFSIFFPFSPCSSPTYDEIGYSSTEEKMSDAITIYIRQRAVIKHETNTSKTSENL